MKAAVVPSINGKWEVKEWKTPQAGPNQVVIKIHASGLCYTDVHLTHGIIPVEFPHVFGHEPVGEIVEVGLGVTSRKVGDRVGVGWVQKGCGRCEWCLRGKKELCQNAQSTGVTMSGSHAEYMLAFADATMLIPDALSYEQAAPISARDTPCGAGCDWPILSRTSGLLWSASGDSAIWRCSTPRLRDSRRLQ